jgi:hypothetical protein
MASIVVVHGIAQQFLGPRVLQGNLAAALADGVGLAGGPALAIGDIAIAFYGDVFRRPGTKDVGWPDGGGVEDAWSTELIMRWWEASAAAEPDLVEPPGASEVPVKTRTPRSVQRALHAMARSRWLAKTGERLLTGTLAQARTYLHDAQIRTYAQQTMAALITPETRVVVAHSLGSVVAYETLCMLPPVPRLTFVTLGSPLGIPNLFFDRLHPAPENGVGRFPACVTAWTNVCDVYDIIALVKDLGPLFPGVVDHRIDNGWRAHELVHHLTAKEVGAAVAAGLEDPRVG